MRTGRRHASHDRPCLFVRILDHLSGGTADVANRNRLSQFTALSLGQAAIQQTPFHQIQFRLGNRALQAKQQAVVVTGRIVDTIQVSNEGPEQGADLQQLVPIPAGPGEPGHFQPDDETHMVKAYLGHQPLKTRPALRADPRSPKVVVDHFDPIGLPPQGQGPVPQGILQARGFLVSDQLLGR
jgi:hypothetical protein